MSAEQGPRYERMDGPVRGILGFGLGLATIVLISLGLLQALFGFFQRGVEEADVPRHPLAEEVVQPPEPRLLADPDGYWDDYLAEQEERLSTPAWIDRDAGVVRVPVDRAIDLVLEEGLDR